MISPQFINSTRNVIRSGKGSGRHEKSLSKVLDEVSDELCDLTDLVTDKYVRRRMFALSSKLDYHAGKLVKRR